MANRIEIVIDSVTKGLESGMKRSESSLGRVGKAAGRTGLLLSAGLAVGLTKSVEAAMAAQNSQARLEQSFKAAGLSATKFEHNIQNVEAHSRTLGFTNEDVRKSLGTLITATGSYTASVKQLSVAENLARFTGSNLATATKALAMLHAGSTRALKQLGLQVVRVTEAEDKVHAAFKKHSGAAYDAALATAKLTDKQKTAAATLETVTQKVYGQAAAYAKTNAGALDQFRAQTENLEVVLGMALLPALLAVTTKLSEFAAVLNRHTTAVKIAIAGLGALAATLLTVSLVTKVYSAAAAIARGAVLAWTAAQWLLNIALDANPIGATIVAIAALTAGIILAYKHSATFRAVIHGALHAVADAADYVKAHWAEMLVEMFIPLTIPLFHLHAVINALKTLWSWTQKLKNIVINITIHFKTPGLPIIPGHGKRSLDTHPLPLGASGAVVNRATFAMIGEKGPEAVVPLNRTPGNSPLGALGGDTYNFYFPNYHGDKRELAETVRQEFVLKVKRGAQLGFT